MADSAPPLGSLVHTELISSDPNKTKAFLEKVFSWRFEQAPGSQPYYMLETPGGDRGGLRGSQGSEQPTVANYVLVADLDETQQNVQEAGGRIVLPRVDVPGMGSFFWFEVPGGPVLACWQPAQ